MWGGRKKRGWGVSWTTSELSASTPTSGRLQPRTRGNGAELQNKGRNISCQNGSLQRKPRLAYGIQCMPERDGKGQGEDSPKQAGSCWFARPCIPPGVWFADDVMTSFSGVTFVLCCFCFASFFVFLLSLKPRPFVQSSFDMQARPDSHTCFFLFFSFFLLFIWRCRFFRVFFVPFLLSLCVESTSYVIPFRMVCFYLVTTTWIFDISLCENLINQSTHGKREAHIDWPMVMQTTLRTTGPAVPANSRQ